MSRRPTRTATPVGESACMPASSRPACKPSCQPSTAGERNGYSHSRAQQRLYGAALVHGAVSVGDLIERERQIENLPWVDLPIPDEIDELREEAPNRRRAAVQVGMTEEEFVAGQVTVGDTDVPHVAARARGMDGLQHRFGGPHRLDDGVGAEAAGEVLDPGCAFVATLLDDVGSAEFERQLLSWLMAAHDDDPLPAEVPGSQHGKKSDCAVADDGDGLARRDLGRHGCEPAGSQDIGGGEEARDEVVGRHLWGGDKGAVGERDAGQFRLRPDGAHELAMDAGALIAGAADLAGVVRSEERPDDELARLDRRDGAADRFDDADVLVAHRRGRLHGLNTSVRPQVRAADAGSGEANDGVGRLDDGRVLALLEPKVAGVLECGYS